MLLAMPAQAREGWRSPPQSGPCPYEPPEQLEIVGPGWSVQVHPDSGLVTLQEVVTSPGRPKLPARLAALGKQALVQLQEVNQRMRVSRSSERQKPELDRLL